MAVVIITSVTVWLLLAVESEDRTAMTLSDLFWGLFKKGADGGVAGVEAWGGAEHMESQKDQIKAKLNKSRVGLVRPIFPTCKKDFVAYQQLFRANRNLERWGQCAFLAGSVGGAVVGWVGVRRVFPNSAFKRLIGRAVVIPTTTGAGGSFLGGTVLMSVLISSLESANDILVPLFPINPQQPQ